MREEIGARKIPLAGWEWLIEHQHAAGRTDDPGERNGPQSSPSATQLAEKSAGTWAVPCLPGVV